MTRRMFFGLLSCLAALLGWKGKAEAAPREQYNYDTGEHYHDPERCQKGDDGLYRFCG